MRSPPTVTATARAKTSALEARSDPILSWGPRVPAVEEPHEGPVYSNRIPGPSVFLVSLSLGLSTWLGAPRNHVHPLCVPSPRCLPQPPSPHSCALRGGWRGTELGRGPSPDLSPAASGQQDSLSPAPYACPGAGVRWALGVGGHSCGPAAVASRLGGPRGQPGSCPCPTVGQLRGHRADTSRLWGNTAHPGAPLLCAGSRGE